MINKIFKCNINDIMTGYRAFSYTFVKTFPVISKNFEIETEMTIHAVDKNLNLENVIIEYRDRQEGSVSKLNTFKDGFQVIRTIIKLFKNYKPLGFFGIISLVLFLAALIAFIPVLVKYLTFGIVTRIPTLVTCGFAILASLICFFAGLILSTIVSQNRQNFEFDLHRASDRYKDFFTKNDKE